jgi:1-acyl-sn-glycerol-3-phosphate acyltransferase
MEWRYEPAADLDKNLVERLRKFPREPHLWIYVLRSLAALLLRAWLRLYHRYEVRGAENLPIGRSFIMVANHQSHLDAPSLIAAIPLRHLHRVFPAAAADYFFGSVPRSAFSAIVVNGLPFDRETKGAESLEVCRQLLRNAGNILLIFPEGTRSVSGEIGRFRSGIARLAAGTDVPVVPCHLAGAHRAFPKGAVFPRPAKLVLTIGRSRRFEQPVTGKTEVERICAELRDAVCALADAPTDRRPSAG